MKFPGTHRREAPQNDENHEGMAPDDKSGVEALGVAVAVIVVVLIIFWILTRIVF